MGEKTGRVIAREDRRVSKSSTLLYGSSCTLECMLFLLGNLAICVDVIEYCVLLLARKNTSLVSNSVLHVFGSGPNVFCC